MSDFSSTPASQSPAPWKGPSFYEPSTTREYYLPHDAGETVAKKDKDKIVSINMGI